MLFLGITKKLSNRGRNIVPYILPLVKSFFIKKYAQIDKGII